MFRKCVYSAYMFPIQNIFPVSKNPVAVIKIVNFAYKSYNFSEAKEIYKSFIALNLYGF